MATAGGSLRQGQAYAVNGMRPEQNIYLVDGAQNMNRMDGGYALKIPVDAIAEFRILTQSAPPEYGGTARRNDERRDARRAATSCTAASTSSCATTRSTRATSSRARSSRSTSISSARTAGGPLRTNRAFFFGYYEGFRNSQGLTTTATVPTAQERQGDFSGMSARR